MILYIHKEVVNMKTTLVCTRKYDGEEYKFFLNEPEYVGEKGVCGIELEPYMSVETPENCFGYSDTVLLNRGIAYTLNRYLPRWILKKVEQKMLDIMQNMGYNTINTIKEV
jgi:hypothetical protein